MKRFSDIITSPLFRWFTSTVIFFNYSIIPIADTLSPLLFSYYIMTTKLEDMKVEKGDGGDMIGEYGGVWMNRVSMDEKVIDYLVNNTIYANLQW